MHTIQWQCVGFTYRGQNSDKRQYYWTGNRF